MLFQVGGQGTRPTFFEMAAAQQLPSSLRAALTYSIGVIVLSISFYLYINFRAFFFIFFILRSDYFHYFFWFWLFDVDDEGVGFEKTISA